LRLGELEPTILLMPLPRTDLEPAFDITRMSHVILDVADLSASRHFYERLLGLVVTVADDEVAYLRGVEEVCHHSLVLRRATSATCRHVGLRVRAAGDLDRAEAYFRERGLAAEWVDAPYQDRTLQVRDDSGVPLELCAGMPTQPRQALRFEQFAGAAAKGIDHVQVLVPDVAKAASFYAGLGFRVTGYASRGGSPDGPFRSIFMSRKGNANDLVLLQNGGPSLHHVAYVVGDPSLTLSRVCDLAAGMGLRDAIEWGPGRHGLGYEQFLYLLDPDGHRVELLGHPYQFIDLEEEPEAWSTEDPDVRNIWGPDPPSSWFQHASPLIDESPLLQA
jgi:catechol 2,3-dioxygenase